MQAQAIAARVPSPPPPPAPEAPAPKSEPAHPVPPQAAPVRAQRQQLLVPDENAIYDTGHFEHMQRVAKLMALSSLVPKALCYDGDERLDDSIVLANCFLVVNQARRWGMDPFAVAQCVGVVHGKLVYEGKLVHAVLEANLGVRLGYTFNDKAGLALGVTVSATLPGETQPRTIFGTVEQWHKGDKSPWASPLNHRRQLRYMGAREWARAHAPGVMLGVISIDEIEREDEYTSLSRRSLRARTISPPRAPPAPPAVTAEPGALTIEPEPAEPDLFSPDEAKRFLLAFDEECEVAADLDTLDEVMAANAETIALRLTPDAQKQANDSYNRNARRFM